MCKLFAILLLTGVWLATPSLAQDRLPTYGKFAWNSAFEGANLVRYGNWYGPGWWGGSLTNRVGMLKPIDSLDAVAQKHDFGYKVAEALGKGRPAFIAHYMAIADAIAIRDAANLPKDPAAWPHPPKDVKLARDLRDRIIVGFRDVWQHVNAAKGLLKKRYDLTDEEEMDGLLGLAEFEKRADAELVGWNKQYAKLQATKAARNKAKPPGGNAAKAPAKSPNFVDVSGTWEILNAGADTRNFVKVSAAGGRFKATCNYTVKGIPYSWTMTTTITPEGRVVGEQVHSALPKPIPRDMQLSADGKKFTGTFGTWVWISR